MSLLRHRWSLALPLLVGCPSSDDDPVDDTDAVDSDTDTNAVDTDGVDTDTDAVDPDTDAPVTPLTAAQAAELEAGLTTALAWIPRIGPEEAWATADRIEERFPARCAERVDFDDGYTVAGTCHFAIGEITAFGRVTWRSYPRVLDGPVLTSLDRLGPRVSSTYQPGDGIEGEAAYTSMNGHATVDDPQGNLLFLGGVYSDTTAASGDVALRRVQVGGPVRDLEPVPGGMVEAGLAPQDLDVLMISGPLGLGRVADGALGGLPAPVQVVQFDSLSVADVACADEPEGVLHARHDTLGWVDVVFDGCDGCAEVRREGAVLGTVCPDMPEEPS